MDEKGQESVRNKKKSVMLALEKRHKIENSQNRAIALTLFGICLTQKTKKKVSEVTRCKQHKQHKRRRQGGKKLKHFIDMIIN